MSCKAAALYATLMLAALSLGAAQETVRTFQVADLSQGALAGEDDFGSEIGFVTWHDGSGVIALSTFEMEPGDRLALPDQERLESVLRVEHAVAAWGGFSHVFADETLANWVSLDLSPYQGLRFWFAGTGSGSQIQFDLFDNRSPNFPGDSAERWFHRFTDDTTEWRLIEIPFSALARRTDFQPGGAPNDGLGLSRASGWALIFPPGQGTTHIARVEAYGLSGSAAAQEGEGGLVTDIPSDDELDSDLLASFATGLDGFTAGPGTTITAVDVLDDAEFARPGQGRSERMVAFSWQERASLQQRFAQAVDASHADGIEFWYRGDGNGRTVRVTVLGPHDDERAWELSWSDEFDGPTGTEPDPGTWTPEIGDGTANGIPGWGNAERQTYTSDPENLFLDGEGNLVIRALATQGDGPPCYYGTPCEYTSARIVTAGSVEVTYGRVEARLKLPRGQGIWPALWMLGSEHR